MFFEIFGESSAIRLVRVVTSTRSLIAARDESPIEDHRPVSPLAALR